MSGGNDDSPSKCRKRIRALERRFDHLDERIETSTKDLSYDKEERGALRWALGILRDMYDLPDHEDVDHRVYVDAE